MSTQPLQSKWADANGHVDLPEIGIEEEQWVRERYNYWIVGQRGTDSGSILHIPREDTEDCTEPVCHTKSTDWNNKPQAVYPVGYLPICKRCFSQVISDEY